MGRTGLFVVLGGVALLAVVGVAGWFLVRLGNDTGGADFTHAVDVDAARVAGLDDAARARALVEVWLDRFITEAGGAARLRDYRIDRVEAVPRNGLLDVTATYAVHPTRRSMDNWVAGSGGRVVDGWLEGKFSRFEMVESAGVVRLRPVGPGPGPGPG